MRRGGAAVRLRPEIMNERRVVITGIGCLSPLGNDLTTTWEGMKAGRSGIARITHLDPEPFECKIAGEVKDFVADGYFKVPKDARRSDRYVQFAVAASKMAMEDSGMDVSTINPRRVGVKIKYKHSNVNISRKVLKRPKFKQKTSFKGYERKYNKCQYK